jgi:hypothetical protein
MPEQELRQAEVVVGPLEVGRGGMPASVHLHPARRAFLDEAGALKAAIPPEVHELPGGLPVVPSAGHVRVPDLLLADRQVRVWPVLDRAERFLEDVRTDEPELAERLSARAGRARRLGVARGLDPD